MDKYKQLDSIILDELNIKVLSRNLVSTEKGVLRLDFCRATQEYTLVLDDKPVISPTLIARIPELVEMVWSK